jgi:purine-cytosine permease-like protein
MYLVIYTHTHTHTHTQTQIFRWLSLGMALPLCAITALVAAAAKVSEVYHESTEVIRESMNIHI